MRFVILAMLVLIQSSCAGVIGLENLDKKGQPRDPLLLAVMPEMEALPGISYIGIDTVSAAETRAVNETWDFMQRIGLETNEDWMKASIEGQKVLSFIPLSIGDIRARVQKDWDNKTVAPDISSSGPVIVAREKPNAEKFLSMMEQDLNAMTVPQLTQLRVNFTVGLMLNQAIAQNDASVGGIPIEILQMNIEMLARGRQAINDELTKRGVTEL